MSGEVPGILATMFFISMSPRGVGVWKASGSTGQPNPFSWPSDVFLSAMAAVGSGRVRADGYQIGDVLKSSLAVEPSGLIRRRRSLLRRWECGRCRFAGRAWRYRAVTAAGSKAQRRKRRPISIGVGDGQLLCTYLVP